MKKANLIFTIFILSTHLLFGQSVSKVTRNFEDPIIADSNSTFIIPIVYNFGLSSSNGIKVWDDVYSNIIFYDFKTDSSKKLFEKDAYILSFTPNNYYSFYREKPIATMTRDWVFYKVMNVDRNLNNYIESDDPVILYVSDNHGNNLKQLTSENENVVSFHIYKEQNIALVKIQRDLNNDGKFNKKDTDFYFVKLDFTTLTWGKKIEVK